MNQNVATEITVEEAEKLWKTKSIFAYDESLEAVWQLNAQEEPVTHLYKAIKDGCVIFLD